MDSDIPSQSSGEKCRVGGLYWACAAEKDVVQENTQGWHFDAKEKVDTQSRKDPSVPLVIDGGGSVLSARVAKECDCVLGQILTKLEERLHADLVRKAKEEKLDTRPQLNVFSHVQMGANLEGGGKQEDDRGALGGGMLPRSGS